MATATPTAHMDAMKIEFDPREAGQTRETVMLTMATFPAGSLALARMVASPHSARVRFPTRLRSQMPDSTQFHPG